ncbi:hypothetical protein [Methanocaldococcus fervens]|nr:hypothetical protein [Methanocaldococcus fervens]
MERDEVIYEKEVNMEGYFRRLRVIKESEDVFLIEEVEKGIIVDNHDMVVLTKEELKEIYKRVFGDDYGNNSKCK